MLNLFNKYKDEGNLQATLFVGSNLLNRYPGNYDVFTAYYDFLCFLCEKTVILEEKVDFARQAGAVLVYFSENVELCEEMVNKISDHKARLAIINRDIETQNEFENTQKVEAIQSENNRILSDIFKEKDKIRQSKSQNSASEAYRELMKLDASINKDFLSERQFEQHQDITKDIISLISEKTREFEYAENVEYNKQAVDSFNKTHEGFNSNKEYYTKNQTALYNLVAKGLFAYEGSRLFPEVSTYFAHIYSYIFGNLDDNGKFAITRWSIECKKG